MTCDTQNSKCIVIWCLIMGNDNEKHVHTKTDKRSFIVIVLIHMAPDALLASVQTLWTLIHVTSGDPGLD